LDGEVGAPYRGVAGGGVVHPLAQGRVERDGKSGDLEMLLSHVVDRAFGAPGGGEPERAARFVGMGARVARCVDAGGAGDECAEPVTGPVDEQLLIDRAWQHGGGEAAQFQSYKSSDTLSGGESAEHLTHGRQPAFEPFGAPAQDIQVTATGAPAGPAYLVADELQGSFGLVRCQRVRHDEARWMASADQQNGAVLVDGGRCGGGDGPHVGRVNSRREQVRSWHRWLRWR
jgi:hypothetical protein